MKESSFRNTSSPAAVVVNYFHRLWLQFSIILFCSKSLFSELFPVDVFVSVYTLSIKKFFKETFWYKFFVPLYTFVPNYFFLNFSQWMFLFLCILFLSKSFSKKLSDLNSLYPLPSGFFGGGVGGESTQDWLCVGMWGCQKVHKKHKKGVCEFFKSKTYFMENYKKCNSFNKIWQIPLVFQILRKYHHIESVELNSRPVICLKIIKLSYVLWITKQCSGLVCQFTMGK